MTRPKLKMLLEDDLHALADRLGPDPTVATALHSLAWFFNTASERLHPAQGSPVDPVGAEVARQALESLRTAFGVIAAVRPVPRAQPAAQQQSSRDQSHRDQPAPLYSDNPQYALMRPARSSEVDWRERSRGGVETDAAYDKQQPPWWENFLSSLFGSRRPPEVATPPPLPAPLQLDLYVRGDALVGALGNALEAADRALVEPAPATPPQPRWADDPRLIRLLQDLLTDGLADDGESALNRIAALRRELRALHEIQVQEFDGANEQFFDFEETPGMRDAAREQTIVPALVAGETVLQRGLVRTPNRTLKTLDRVGDVMQKDEGVQS